VLFTIVAAFVVALSVAVWIGARRQQREVSAEIDGLLRAVAPNATLASVRELDSLPPPVVRYLRWALPERSSIRVVRIQQIGTLRTDVRSNRWMAFTAEQVAAPTATGFVWNARVTVVPLLHVRVLVAFI
jgi:hypothetical protein